MSLPNLIQKSNGKLTSRNKIDNISPPTKHPHNHSHMNPSLDNNNRRRKSSYFNTESDQFLENPLYDLHEQKKRSTGVLADDQRAISRRW